VVSVCVLVRNIAHGDGVGRTKCTGNDGTLLVAQGDRVGLTTGVKQRECGYGFSLFLVFRYQNYTEKVIFATFNWCKYMV
jgi:hypothetical protein